MFTNQTYSSVNQYFHFYISVARYDTIVQKELGYLKVVLNEKRILNLEKNLYHQERIRVDKSSLDIKYIA